LSGTSPRICRVVFDTSALLVIGEYGSFPDVADSLESVCEHAIFTTPRRVMDELSRIALERGRRGLAARLLLKLIEGGYLSIEVVNVEGCTTADECVLKLASDFRDLGERVIVATLDRKIAGKLREMGIMRLTWWYSRRKFTLCGSSEDTNAKTSGGRPQP
jgi:rRNA-processing protein FCF1